MGFQLKSIVPWGRTFDEYQKMFDLKEKELMGKIAGFGDGPASFNYELTCRKGSVTSFDPIYQFSKDQLKQRIQETKNIVMKQTAENMENYIWNEISSLEQLESLRMRAMTTFLEDYEKGLKEGRYIYHELPNRMPFPDNYFDLGLSSHFLLMYTELGLEFHEQAIREMLRVCKEVRIFPVVDLDGGQSELLERILETFKKKYKVDLVTVSYHFQKNGNQMLTIQKEQ